MYRPSLISCTTYGMIHRVSYMLRHVSDPGVSRHPSRVRSVGHVACWSRLTTSRVSTHETASESHLTLTPLSFLFYGTSRYIISDTSH
jgi:hypothetical protein